MADEKPAILLVDDEPDILFSLRGLLRHEFSVHTAEGGLEAIEVLAREPIQVIMTDQRMPGMTGVELLSRSHEICPEAIPIVFTGYADIKAVVEAVNRGHIFRYITKPWDPDDLAAVLHEAADRYRDLTERKRLLADLRQFVSQAVTLASSQDSPVSMEPEMWEKFTHEGKALLERLQHAVGPF